MAGTTFHEICQGIAAHFNEPATDIVKHAYYPFPSQIASTAVPAMILEPVTERPEEYIGGRATVWIATVRLICVSPRVNAHTGIDFTIVNELAPLVADEFLKEGVRKDTMPSIPSAVRNVMVSTVEYSGQYFYGTSQTFAAATVALDIKYTRRQPGG